MKLTDFGIALALDRARWTRPSVVKGKFGYMAPEQLRGEPLDVRTDLFAAGVVLFELLARKRPWFAPAGSLDEIRAIERGEIASILECRPRLDRALAMAIDRLLALDIRDRYPNCDAALRALAPFAAGDLGSLRLAAIVDALLPPPRPQISSGKTRCDHGVRAQARPLVGGSQAKRPQGGRMRSCRIRAFTWTRGSRRDRREFGRRAKRVFA